MDEAKARALLEEAITDDGNLYSIGWYLAWTPGYGHATLDGGFSADELEAIAWWMRNKGSDAQKQQQSNKPVD